MRTSNEISATEYALKPELAFLRTTAVSQVKGTVGFDFRRFDKDELDTNDSFLDLASYYRTERSRWDLGARYTRDTTLDSELEESGIVYERIRRTSRSLNPAWSYMLDPTRQLKASYSISQIRYENNQNTYFSDYDYQGLTLEYNQRWSAKTSVTGNLSQTRYENGSNTVRSDTTQVQVGASHEFSERWSASALAGARRTRTTTRVGLLVCPGLDLRSSPLSLLFGPCVDPVTLAPLAFTVQTESRSNSSTGSVFTLQTAYGFETGSLSASATRSVSPSATNGLIVRDRLSLSAERRLSEKLTLSAKLGWYRTSATDSEIGNLNRKYLEFQPRLTWRIDRDWRLKTSYRFRKQSYESQLDSATGNTLTVTLVYAWPKMAVSR
ncbi:hypothetical protein QVG61_12075 [Thiohalobacter sp. IOR34]|uniref:hypothetical protein n=1 Tax=Thiohalobacter sp. IOR34 TaxID=3057176 RepID=UPI0025B114F1|nr:hypothetical protein [Thiohalobacter sp. IOR34]WJW75212.1 hypothetical protein QVG61_12075 [Thiohalobacter sp. IOR34]